MAQQIARNNQAIPPDEAAEKVAGHLHAFWTPAMLRELEAFAAYSPQELDPIVVSALDILRERGEA